MIRCLELRPFIPHPFKTLLVSPSAQKKTLAESERRSFFPLVKIFVLGNLFSEQILTEFFDKVAAAADAMVRIFAKQAKNEVQST